MESKNLLSVKMDPTAWVTIAEQFQGNSHLNKETIDTNSISNCRFNHGPDGLFVARTVSAYAMTQRIRLDISRYVM